MKKEIIVTADSVDEALEQAAAKLSRKKEDFSYEVLQNEKKGLFGKIKKRAEVKIVYFDGEDEIEKNKEKDKSEFSNQEIAEKKEEYIAKKIQIAQDYLLNILEKMGIEKPKTEVVRQKGHVLIKMEGNNIAIAIGRRGETIDALQYLVTTTANRIKGEYVRFVLDSGNFREKREETLKNLAMNIAKKALQNGRRVTLEPMNPYERRIIHTVISLTPGVFSKSVGMEPNRKVVVYAENRVKNEKKKNKPNYDKKDYFSTDVSSQPRTYNFEKEFLKPSKNSKLYTKIDLDEKD